MYKYKYSQMLSASEITSTGIINFYVKFSSTKKIQRKLNVFYLFIYFILTLCL